MLASRPSTPKPDRHLTTFGAMLSLPILMAEGIAPALQISAIEHPDLPIGWLRDRKRQLGALGVEARARTGGGAGMERRAHGLCAYLFGEVGFTGNDADFGDPRNSCLSDVLDRKLGIPITLAVILMAVGRDAGIPIEGVGAPGHFLCSFTTEEGERIFIDPFRGGTFLRLEEAQIRVREVVGDVEPPVCDHLLRPAAPHDILARMLHNLKNTYAQRGNARRLLTSLDWLIMVQPANLSEIRNRGIVLLRLGHFHRAVQDLAFYVQSAPEAEDRDLIRTELERAIALRAQNN